MVSLLFLAVIASRPSPAPRPFSFASSQSLSSLGHFPGSAPLTCTRPCPHPCSVSSRPRVRARVWHLSGPRPQNARLFPSCAISYEGNPEAKVTVLFRFSSLNLHSPLDRGLESSWTLYLQPALASLNSGVTTGDGALPLGFEVALRLLPAFYFLFLDLVDPHFTLFLSLKPFTDLWAGQEPLKYTSSWICSYKNELGLKVNWSSHELYGRSRAHVSSWEHLVEPFGSPIS